MLLSEKLDSYILKNDLKLGTENYYRRIVSVFRAWAKRDVPVRSITPKILSEFLRDKQSAGARPHYVKSLRNGLLAVTGLDAAEVRKVKLPPLDPGNWSEVEVAKLVASCAVLPSTKQAYYRRIILVGYYTGLSYCDLRALRRDDCRDDGVISVRRAKTGTKVVVWIPADLLAELPANGRLFPHAYTDEQFRKDIRRVVRAAGLRGSFKVLRSSSGTAAEIATGGLGHLHLGNTRSVFERHYLGREAQRAPVRLLLPPKLG